MINLFRALQVILIVALLSAITVVSALPGYAQEEPAVSPTPLPAPEDETEPAPTDVVTDTVPAGQLEVDNGAQTGSEIQPEADEPEADGAGLTTPETNASPAQTSLNDNIVSFELLDVNAKMLEGPYDSERFRFYLPAHWSLTNGAELHLNLTVYFGGVGAASSEENAQIFGGSLTVSFNDTTLSKVLLDHTGDYQLVIPIPETALVSPEANGRHELSLNLDSALSCEFDLQTAVEVHPTSFFVLPYEPVTPPIDLTLYPYPVYQRSFLPDVATVILPDEPTSEEMQAALSIIAGLGHATFGRVETSLIPVGQMENSIRDETHLIFVGKSSTLPIPAEVRLPITERSFNLPEQDPDDGVIQLAVSPWNSTKVIVVASGASDTAVVKAGQALSSAEIVVANRPDLALVHTVQSFDEAEAPIMVDRTFDDLGYAAVRLQNKGENYIGYTFNLPAGRMLGPEAYLDLVFTHSALLDYEQSGLVVSLNNESIGSIRFSDETADHATARITIPRYSVHPGVNELVIKALLVPTSVCYNPNLDSLWLTIRPESSLHLPLLDRPVEIMEVFNLGSYPDPFTLDPTLSTTAFILSPDDLAAWNATAQIAFELGKQMKGFAAKPTAVFPTDVSEDILQEFHLLIVGKASSLPIIAELGEALPAPFELDSNFASDQELHISYRIPEGSSLGYIQLLPAPWNDQRVIVAALGTDDLGVQWASNALITPAMRSQLAGNFAVIQDQQVVVGRIPASFRQTATDTAPKPETPLEAATADTQAAAVSDTGPSNGIVNPAVTSPSYSIAGITLPPLAYREWILLAVGVSTALFIVILTGVIISAWLRRRKYG